MLDILWLAFMPGTQGPRGQNSHRERSSVRYTVEVYDEDEEGQ